MELVIAICVFVVFSVLSMFWSTVFAYRVTEHRNPTWAEIKAAFWR